MKSMGGSQRSRFFLASAFTIFWAAGAWSAVVWAAPASAARAIILDDSGTEALDSVVALHWKSIAPSRSANGNLMVGTATFRVRINVAPWLKRNARIYLMLPLQEPGPLSVSWTTHGKLLPGQLQSGSRTLVYSGAITRPFLEDEVTFQFNVNGAQVARPFPVNFQFVMDE
jgi:hypothetical protein